MNREDIPHVCTLEITTVAGCRVGCSYCPQDAFAREHRHVSRDTVLSLQTFETCLQDVPREVDISFAGYAEAWLNPDCTSMVEIAAARGHGIRIYTTLVGMTVRDVERLSRLTLKVFAVHLPDDGTYMKVRVDDEYLATLRAVLAADIPALNFATFGPLHEKVRAIVPNGVAQRKILSRAGNVDPSVALTPKTRLGPIRCRQERQYRNVLLPNGDVSLCCMDFARQHVIGNLLEDSYASLHDGPEFHAVLDRMSGAPGPLVCRTCEFAVLAPRGAR